MISLSIVINMVKFYKDKSSLISNYYSRKTFCIFAYIISELIIIIPNKKIYIKI